MPLLGFVAAMAYAKKEQTRQVRLNAETLDALKELLQPIGAKSDAMAVEWAVDSMLQAIKSKTLTVPPVIAIARGFHGNGLPKWKGDKENE